jgi:hypothetical protein
MKRRLLFALEVLMAFFSMKLTQNALNKAEAEPLIRSTKIKYTGLICRLIPL